MRSSATQPLKKPTKSMGGLIGGEAKKLEAHDAKKKSICGDVLEKAITYAMAVLEVNASMGLIVAAPTAGSAGVANALVAAEMSLSGIRQLIPFDQMLDTMYAVGKRLPAELRETAQGGCATTPAACAACGLCG